MKNLKISQINPEMGAISSKGRKKEITKAYTTAWSRFFDSSKLFPNIYRYNQKTKYRDAVRFEGKEIFKAGAYSIIQKNGKPGTIDRIGNINWRRRIKRAFSSHGKDGIAQVIINHVKDKKEKSYLLSILKNGLVPIN